VGRGRCMRRYTGNLHKWCFTEKGVAFLYTSPRHQERQQALVISHNAHAPYQRRFFMQVRGRGVEGVGTALPHMFSPMCPLVRVCVRVLRGRAPTISRGTTA